MINPYVVIAPVITEKSLLMAKEENAFTFYVDPSADKTEIKKAIEAGFGVHVSDIKTVKVPGKVKRTGSKRRPSTKADRKKAIIVLPPGEKIELFDL